MSVDRPTASPCVAVVFLGRDYTNLHPLARINENHLTFLWDRRTWKKLCFCYFSHCSAESNGSRYFNPLEEAFAMHFQFAHAPAARRLIGERRLAENGRRFHWAERADDLRPELRDGGFSFARNLTAMQVGYSHFRNVPRDELLLRFFVQRRFTVRERTMKLIRDVLKHGIEVRRRVEAGGHRLYLALDLLPIRFDGEVEKAIQTGESDGASRRRVPAPPPRPHSENSE